MKIIKEITGATIGILSFFIWLYLLNYIQFQFFSEQELVQGTVVTVVKYPEQYIPIFAWFTIGVLPLCLFVGRYMLLGSSEGLEKKRETVAIKSILIGYFMWLSVTLIIALFEINITNRINMAAGVLTMIIVYYFMNNKIARNEGDQRS